MTASNVELLPLPEDVRAWLSSMRKVNNDGSAEHVELWFQSYARANVEASTKYYRDMLCQSQDDVMKLSAETEALRAEVEKAKRSVEHTHQWYAVRLEKIKEVAKRVGLWSEVAAIIANGSSSIYDPPTYAQQLNIAKHETKASEARADRLAEALRGLKDLMLERVKWEPCDCGCPQQRTPDGPHSVTWLRAAQKVEIAISKAEDRG